MTTTDLVHAFLYEAGLDALAAKARTAMAKTDFGTLDVGVDTGPRPICYVTSWGHETSFARLDIEPIEECERDVWGD